MIELEAEQDYFKPRVLEWTDRELRSTDAYFLQLLTMLCKCIFNTKRGFETKVSGSYRRWISMLLLYVFNIVLVQSGLVSAIQGLTRNFGTGCVENGTSVTYDCTAVDNGVILASTVYDGTAFTCEPVNGIALEHFLYNTTGTGMVTCGTLSAMSVGVSGNGFMSQLTVMASRNLDGSTIRCTVARQITVGTDTISVGVTPPPPGPVSITFSLDSDPSFTVSWSPPSGTVVGGVGGYMFGVTGDNCGCVDMNVSADTTSVTCSGWSANDQTCSFEVRTLTQDCGFVSSTAVTGNVILSIPSTPTVLSVQPNYNVNGSTQYIDVEFTGVDAPPLGPNIDSTVSYTVRFVGSSTFSFTTSTCNSTNHCTLRVDGSQLSPSDTYTVSVVASNVVGSEPPATFPSQVATFIILENIVRVVVNATASTVSCILGSSLPVTDNFVCSISYGPSPNNCDMFTDSSSPTIGRPGDTVTIILTQDVNSGAEFCYTVRLNHGSIQLTIEGTFVCQCDPRDLGANPTSVDEPGMVTVMNGVVHYDSVVHSSIAQLMCSDGYLESNDSRDRTCLCRGGWSGGAQTCVLETTPSLPYGTAIALSVILTFLLTLVLGISIGVVSVLVYNKCKRGTDQSSSQPTELNSMSGPVYEEPVDFKPDPHTAGNVAYGHVQPLHSRQ